MRGSRLYPCAGASCVGVFWLSMGLYLLFPTAFTPFTFAFISCGGRIRNQSVWGIRSLHRLSWYRRGCSVVSVLVTFQVVRTSVSSDFVLPVKLCGWKLPVHRTALHVVRPRVLPNDPLDCTSFPVVGCLISI